MSADHPRRVLLAVAGAVTLLWLLMVLLWRDAPFALTFDDAFYYFGIARNVAEGHGSTFDGINLTNGYHPLWMLLSVPVFGLGLDGTGAVRALLALQVLCYGGAARRWWRSWGAAASGAGDACGPAAMHPTGPPAGARRWWPSPSPSPPAIRSWSRSSPTGSSPGCWSCSTPACSPPRCAPGRFLTGGSSATASCSGCC